MALAGTGLRFLLGFVFLAASIPKIAARSEFELAVGNYRLLPQRLVAPFAALLPPIELACAAALFVGAAVPLIAVCVAFLLVLFGAAVAINLARGREIDCGCAGRVAPRRITWQLVGRNLVLAGAASLLAAAPPTSGVVFSIPWPTHAAASVSTGAVTAAAITAALALLLIALASNALRLRGAAQRFTSSRGLP